MDSNRSFRGAPAGRSRGGHNGFQNRSPQSFRGSHQHSPPSRASRGSRRENHTPRGQPSTGGRFYRKPDLLPDSLAWRHLSELKVKIIGVAGGLPENVVVRDLYEHLKEYGTIVKIEIYDDHHRKATVMFSPPPQHPFWCRNDIGHMEYGNRTGKSHTLLKAEMVDYNRTGPQGQKYYECVAACLAEQLDFGFKYEADHVVIMRSLVPFESSLGPAPIRLTVNAERALLTVSFSISEEYLRSGRHGPGAPTGRKGLSQFDDEAPYEFKLQISFKQLDYILMRDIGDSVELLMSVPVSNPPTFYKKMPPETTMQDNPRYWTQNAAWFRRTAICSEKYGEEAKFRALSLHEPDPFVNIGRWTTYRLQLSKAEYLSKRFQEVQAILREHNVSLKQHDLRVSSVKDVKEFDPGSFWKALDQKFDGASNASILSCVEDAPLPFAVRYQLEACISKDVFNVANLTPAFVKTLTEKKERKAQRLLERLADEGNHFYDPMKIFSQRVIRGSKKGSVPSNHVLQRSVAVTPSSIELMTPNVDESNRIIRQFDKYKDHFIRVVFKGDGAQGKIWSSTDETNDAIFNRVRRTLHCGIIIAGRKFEWLASGNSQFREHGAYFFNSIPGVLTAEMIRGRMGEYAHEGQIAKAAARMGQCFSTTREFKITVEEGIIEDVKKRDSSGAEYNFTDGVGKMSLGLSRLIATDMKFSEHTSAYQIRFKGCKGVLAVSPELRGIKVQTRGSQCKFGADRNRLEIIRPANLVRSELNRQLAIILSTLGVADDVFLDKVNQQLYDINQAMSRPDVAIDMLSKRVDVNLMTLSMADMVKHNFMEQQEPFLQTLLHLWRAWSHKKLKEKAAVQVDEGAFVMGVTDEEKVLRGHFDALQPGPKANIEQRQASLPEIFLQISNEDCNRRFRVVTGVCLLARNPSLHPGDIRVVRAVDRPELYHHKNVVVFPQTGDRDIPGMCSGGDLDGDDFFVSWDPTLMPPPAEWNHKPMHQEGSGGSKTNTVVTNEGIKDFFVAHIKNDNLGQIANTWLACADQLPHGAKDPICQALAQLHSVAVDFPKTGNPACGKKLNKLRPRKYPHFMESSRPIHKIYKSSSVLGKMYDLVERVEFNPSLHLPFDHRILSRYEPDRPRDDDILALKADYDTQLKRVMAQFGIQTEFELWTGFLMGHDRTLKSYEIQTKVGNLATAIKDRFRENCIKLAGGSHEIRHLGPFITAMYKLTADQVGRTIQNMKDLYGYSEDTTPNMQPEEMPFMSFPWIFTHQLGKIAKGAPMLNGEEARTFRETAMSMFAQADGNEDEDTDDADGTEVYTSSSDVQGGEGLTRPSASAADARFLEGLSSTHHQVPSKNLDSKNTLISLELDSQVKGPTPNTHCHAERDSKMSTYSSTPHHTPLPSVSKIDNPKAQSSFPPQKQQLCSDDGSSTSVVSADSRDSNSEAHVSSDAKSDENDLLMLSEYFESALKLPAGDPDVTGAGDVSNHAVAGGGDLNDSGVEEITEEELEDSGGGASAAFSRLQGVLSQD